MDRKEAIDVIRKNYPHVTSSGSQFETALRTLIPELKESESERTVKALIHFFSNDENTSFEYWEGIPKAEVLAWLEKQGETSTEDFGEFINILSKQFPEVSFAKLSRIAVRVKKWLEKQGKETIGYIHTIDKDDNYTIEPILSNSSNVGKDEDKVEPKFKVGDWVLVEQIENIINGPFMIKEIGKYGYLLDGIRETVLPFTSEHCMHLWTIQNAKDGDVLHCWIDGDEFVLIYKGIKDGYITTYGHLYQKLKSFSEEPTSMFYRTIQGHFTPATKEQRDLLFQKMKESGYEWDAEHKQLKKIEQKSNWSKEDDNCLSTIIAEFSKCAGKSVSKDEWMRCNDWLNSIRNRVQPQPKQEWSKEDDIYIKNIILAVEKQYPIAAKDIVSWLKSLKDRVQPTLAWNENNEVALESAATNYAQDKYLPVQTAQAFMAGARWLLTSLTTSSPAGQAPT